MGYARYQDFVVIGALPLLIVIRLLIVIYSALHIIGILSYWNIIILAYNHIGILAH